MAKTIKAATRRLLRLDRNQAPGVYIPVWYW